MEKIYELNGREYIKPCPFCGSRDIAVGDFFARCNACRTQVAEGPLQKSVQVRAWNRRDLSKRARRGACPFCGGSHIGLSVTEADKGRFWRYCNDCFAQGPEGASEDEAEELWGRRARVQGWTQI